MPDVPLEEALEVKQVVESAGLKWIMLVAPTSELNRRARIAECSSGFVYQIAVAGITGERATLPPELKDNIASLRKVSGLPVCVGFGISTPETCFRSLPRCRRGNRRQCDHSTDLQTGWTRGKKPKK